MLMNLPIFIYGYSFERDVIGTLRVCNDSAKRGVKLVADFLYLAKKRRKLAKLCESNGKGSKKSAQSP